jgi:hypothetical protein
MSTLSEIEAAVDKLPHPEQQILLEHLSRKLGARSTITEESRAQRERWIQKLAACGTAGLPANRGCHSRSSLTISVVSVADELLGFFSAGKALPAGVGFREVPELALKASRVATGSLTRHEVRTVFRRREAEGVLPSAESAALYDEFTADLSSLFSARIHRRPWPQPRPVQSSDCHPLKR